MSIELVVVEDSTSTLVIEDGDETVELVIEEETTTLVISESDPGPPGPPGPPRAAQTYPVVAVSSWSHSHGLNYPPMVWLQQGTELVLVGAQYPDNDTVYITFPVPFTGTIVIG